MPEPRAISDATSLTDLLERLGAADKNPGEQWAIIANTLDDHADSLNPRVHRDIARAMVTLRDAGISADEVEGEYNKFHDRLGRFSSGSGFKSTAKAGLNPSKATETPQQLRERRRSLVESLTGRKATADDGLLPKERAAKNAEARRENRLAGATDSSVVSKKGALHVRAKDSDKGLSEADQAVVANNLNVGDRLRIYANGRRGAIERAEIEIHDAPRKGWALGHELGTNQGSGPTEWNIGRVPRSVGGGVPLMSLREVQRLKVGDGTPSGEVGMTENPKVR